MRRRQSQTKKHERTCNQFLHESPSKVVKLDDPLMRKNDAKEPILILKQSQCDFRGELEAGAFFVRWDAQYAASGVYTTECRLTNM